MTPGPKLFKYAFGGVVIFLFVICFLRQVALIFSIHLEGTSKLLLLNDMTRFDSNSIFSYRHHKFDHRRYSASALNVSLSARKRSRDCAIFPLFCTNLACLFIKYLCSSSLHVFHPIVFFFVLFPCLIQHVFP